MPAVSVVMAAKNYARYLPTAVGSVLAQTVHDWDLVVIDDGSTDDTPAAIRPFLTDSRIRYHRSDKLGQPRAKNLGVRLSRAPLVAFLDADDAWLPAKLERQLPLFADPAVGVTFTARRLIDDAGVQRPAPPADPPRGDVLDEVFVRNFVCFSSVILRRELFDRVGGFDPQLDLAIDYDLWLRAARVCRFDFVPDELVLYRTGHGNLSAKLADRIATAFAIMNRAVRRGGLGRVADGYASTEMNAGWLYRGADRRRAAAAYLRALAWPGWRRAGAKGLLGLLTAGRGEVTAVNRPENG